MLVLKALLGILSEIQASQVCFVWPHHVLSLVMNSLSVCQFSQRTESSCVVTVQSPDWKSWLISWQNNPRFSFGQYLPVRPIDYDPDFKRIHFILPSPGVAFRYLKYQTSKLSCLRFLAQSSSSVLQGGFTASGDPVTGCVRSGGGQGRRGCFSRCCRQPLHPEMLPCLTPELGSQRLPDSLRCHVVDQARKPRESP